MTRLLQALISFYQLTMSPDHGWLLRGRYPYGFCRFYPSCSQYAYDAIGRFGPIRGIILTARRIVRCNPWTQPQVDQIPQHNF